ncbi:Unknown protein sequence [Pseudomonas syringae pv. maculicola]|nr:Unknown protein sequence [Pseudomonas syringae pv. maculicola]
MAHTRFYSCVNERNLVGDLLGGGAVRNEQLVDTCERFFKRCGLIKINSYRSDTFWKRCG